MTSRRNLLAGLAVTAAAGAPSAARDLANQGGGAGGPLGTFRRPEPAAVGVPEGVQHAQVVYPANFGMTGRYEQDATALMQAMFDQIPDGAIVDFAHGVDLGGDYRITDTIVIRRGISLRGRNSRIVGVMRDATSDLIRYQPAAEMRGVLIEGMRLTFNRGGRDALAFAGGDVGVIENVVSRCSIAGGSGGYAIRMTGLGNHFNVVRDCTLIGTSSATGGVFIGTADGNKLHDNLIAGIGTGVRLQILNGAYKTAIIGGAITARDVGVHVAAGQQIDIERVQFEQGRGHPDTDRNQAVHKSHIVIGGSGTFPAGEEVRDVRIVACNLGGGQNQESAISLVRHARDVLIDENYFAAAGASGIDVRILDASVLWTIVGPHNRVGGLRGGIARGEANTVDPKDLLITQDAGTGTYGVYRGASALNMANGWRAQAGFAFWKHSDDILRFRSALTAGTVTPGTVIAVLPPGYRPRTELRLSVPTDDDGVDARLAVSVAGVISVRNVRAGAVLYMDQVAAPIKGRAAYLSGPY